MATEKRRSGITLDVLDGPSHGDLYALLQLSDAMRTFALFTTNDVIALAERAPHLLYIIGLTRLDPAGNRLLIQAGHYAHKGKSNKLIPVIDCEITYDSVKRKGVMKWRGQVLEDDLKARKPSLQDQLREALLPLEAEFGRSMISLGLAIPAHPSRITFHANDAMKKFAQSWTNTLEWFDLEFGVELVDDALLALKLKRKYR